MSAAGPHTAPVVLPTDLASLSLTAVHEGLIAELCVGFLLAVQVVYSVRYFRLYGGKDGDGRLLQSYVAVSGILGLNFAVANTALAWATLTEAVEHGFIIPYANKGLQAWWIWSLALCGSCTLSFWVWRTWRVSAHRWVRYVALGGWILSSVAYFAFAGLLSTQHWRQSNNAQQFRQLQTCGLVAVWITAGICVWCGGWLAYELGWKRRALLARSKALDAFLVVALTTSSLISLVTLAAAICVTIGVRDVDVVAFYAFFCVCCCCPYASSACAIFSLNHRDKLRNSRDGSSGPGAVAALPAWREPRSATARRSAHLDANDLLHIDSAVAYDGKRDGADGDPYSREERAVELTERRVLVFPAPLAVLTRGSGHGEARRERKQARRKSEVEERAARTSGISVVVDVVQQEECEELPYAVDDIVGISDDPGTSGSQDEGSLEGSLDDVRGRSRA